MYEVTKDFKGSNYGWDVVEYTKGQVVELSEDLAAVALKEKWVKRSPRKSDAKVVAAKAALADAAEADKPAAQAALDAATAERAALG